MQSEFYNVALDRIRYSLVWESNRTLRDALDVQPTDEVLVICSAGCNALNALLLNPRRITAIDLNPVQVHLLSFKQHLIRHHEHRVLRALLGLDGVPAVLATWQEIEASLPTDMRAYWAPFFESHPAGILSAGRLESYLLGFVPTLSAELQAHLRQLVNCDTVAEQRALFFDHLHGSAFEEQFITYFDQANLSRGRDPKLFKYAAESGGREFYARLVRQLSTELLRDNFFIRFFLFGPDDLPEAVLPPCYQARNFETLRARLNRLDVATGEAVEYLLSDAGKRITKASLSNIFEYVSPAEFERVCRTLFADCNRPLRLVYWNLLQMQGAKRNAAIPLDKAASQSLTQQDQACFYLRDVRVLDSRLLPAEVPATLAPAVSVASSLPATYA
jgi:S-adenosylmethionine-diacylglycerol 3-amino-3-carboxypropyl transferase